MSYYKILGMEKEPFSTSPDPDFFYQSREHQSILFKLRTAIELKRGASVVMGNIGTGKTTVSRRLAQCLQADDNLIMVMILNPSYETEKQFLIDLAQRFHININPQSGRVPQVLDYLQAIEKFLFEQCVESKKTVVLLIDESQKLSNACIETLRSLLNYETNEFKTLQLILMGQMELLPRIVEIKNFWDRIALKYVLDPLGEEETKELINYRLKHAGYASRYSLFSDEAISVIHDYTKGYPRKIAMICHNALEYLVMYKKDFVDKEIAQELIHDEMKLIPGATSHASLLCR